MNAAPLPTQIGKYRVKRLLGAGGMGRVFLASDPDIGRDVAIKLVTLGSDPQAGERFLREAQTMGRMNHPNIATLLEFGVDQGTPFLVLEFLSGEDLSQWMLRPHTLREQAQVMLDVAQAISAAHKVGVLHRDLKPENVRVLDDGRCKLLDFGIAQSGAAQLTASGYFVGTPEFVAPEVMSGLAHSAAADVYALGLLYYTMICGENPFRGDTVQATVARVVQRDPPLITTRMVGVPPALVELIHRCLSKTPESRPESADLVVTALNQILPQIDPATRLTEVPRSTSTATQPVAAEPSQTRATESVRQAAASAPTRRRALVALALVTSAALGWFLWPAPEPVAPPTVVPAPRVEPQPTPPAAVTAVPQETSTATTAVGNPEPTDTDTGAAPITTPAKPTLAPSSAPPPVSAPRHTEVAAPAPTRVESAPTEPKAPAPLTSPPPVTADSAADDATKPAITSGTAAVAVPAAPSTAVDTPIAITISKSSPHVVRAGRTVTLRIEGTGLTGVDAVTVSFGGAPDSRFRVGALKHEGDDALEFSLNVARGVPLGSYSLLLQGERVRANPIILEVSL